MLWINRAGTYCSGRRSGRGRYWDRTSDLCRVEANQGVLGCLAIGGILNADKGLHLLLMPINLHHFSTQRVLCASWDATEILDSRLAWLLGSSVGHRRGGSGVHGDLDTRRR